MNLIPVLHNKNLGRDPRSKAIVNTDYDALERAKRKKLEYHSQAAKINKLERDVENIKDTLDKILEKLEKIK